jgi:hypothetical protein
MVKLPTLIGQAFPTFGNHLGQATKCARVSDNAVGITMGMLRVHLLKKINDTMRLSMRSLYPCGVHIPSTDKIL